MAKVGFLINPIAGMGGRVGLKGTDGPVILKKARDMGAVPVAHSRALETLKSIIGSGVDIHWLTCSQDMGENTLKDAGFKQEEHYTIVYRTHNATTSEDTNNACHRFMDLEVDLLLFCGGDGTARDIVSVIGKDIPVIGIPAGVKMFSSVFAVNPAGAARIVSGFINEDYIVKEAEVMDIDEEEYRDGKLNARLFDYARTPYERSLVQSGKTVYGGADEECAKADIARHVVEIMESQKDTLFILGAGSTLEAIGEELRIDKTLLGVDVVKNGSLIASDVNEARLFELLENGNKAAIIVGVIGSQGFVFGRGNQQLSPSIIRKVGINGITIVATPHKMAQTPVLRVDTGDDEVDRMLSCYHRIVIGYHELRMAKITAIEG